MFSAITSGNLSPLLFVFYTSDNQSVFDSRFIINLADDSGIISLLQDQEVDPDPVLGTFIKWCDDSYLQLNVSKTKEMLIDFHQNLPFHINYLYHWHGCGSIKPI